MGLGLNDEENPATEEEAERQRLRTTDEDGMELQKIPVKVKDAEYPEIVAHSQKELVKTAHLKYALLGFNLILGILGLVMLSLSVWIRADPEFSEYEMRLNADNFYTVCYLFMFTGLVILTVAFVGCFGAVTENQWMLSVYFIVFCIIFIVELAALVLMWSAPYSKTIRNQLSKQIKKQVDGQEVDDSAKFFMDFIQQNLECCGAESSRDYRGHPPNSCLNIKTGSVNAAGCAVKMLSYLRGKAGAVGGIALPIMLLQLMGLLASACLIRNIRRDSSYQM